VSDFHNAGSKVTSAHALGRYWVTKASDQGLTVELVEGKNLTRVFIQDTVLDFPRLNVITRDNASVYIDSVLSFKVVNPKLMLYSCVNLQAMLSKLLQVRALARGTNA
jgi:regulator of protease activity HflC (stomatin/prohibitin superfamily)